MLSTTSSRQAAGSATESAEIVLPRVRNAVNETALVPGSKSLANRALLLAAMADGPSEISNIPDSDDVRGMVECLRRLGASLLVDGETRQAPPDVGASEGSVHCARTPKRIRVQGLGGRWPNTEATLPAGDAGTVLRFMTAAASLGHGEYYLDGSATLSRRPMRGLVEALQTLGAKFEFEGRENHCPFTLHAAGLRGGHVAFHSPESSQYVSALLQAAVHARGDVFIEVEGPLRSRPFIDMTLRIMSLFGATVAHNESPRWIVAAGQRYRGTSICIEPDATNASYFFGLAALAGGRMTVRDLAHEPRQGDLRIIDLLTEMGCTSEQRPDASVTVSGPADGRLRGIDADLGGSPDLAPTLAVLALFADKPSRFHGVPHLRLKESDRVMSIARNIENFGGRVEVHEDGITVHPAASPRAATIETFDDHRIAMAFTLASARLDGVRIQGATCVSKSFPGFFDEWRRVTA